MTSENDINSQIEFNDFFDNNVTINKLEQHGTWEYGIVKDYCCHICKFELFAKSPNSITKERCLIGKCGHAYHSSCINNWLKNNSKKCPYCSCDWEVQD